MSTSALQRIHPRPRPVAARRWLQLLVATLMLLLCAGPATAARERFTDANDRKGFDIRVVKVQYAGRLDIRLVHDGKIAFDHKYKFWFNTRAKNAGPEYSFVFKPNFDFLRFRKVNNFSGSGTAVRTCGRMWGASADVFRPRRDVLAFVGARCLGRPSRVQVSAQLIAKGPNDWAPGFHEFSGWVSRY